MARQASTTDRRKHTIGSVYRRLYDARRPCTRASLAEDLGLSLPTIYQCLKELMEAGLIHYAGEEESTGGRRPQSIALVADARVAVGISITEDRTRMVLTDLYLQELAYHVVPHELPWTDEAFAVSLARDLEAFLDSCVVDRRKLLGVGIAFPGVLTPDRARVLYAPTLGLKNIDPRELLRHIPYPAFWENDATCGGLAELFIRGGQANMAYLSLENGVGGAVLITGSPYVGEHQRSGEFGHMCVEPAGLPCKCGKRGCLEAYCSAQRITGTFGVTLPEFFDGLSRHNPEYEALWHDLLRHLAIGVNNIRMALDCDVVLGGFLSEYLPPYMAQLQEYVSANNTFESSAEYLQLSKLRKRTVPLGAALHFIQSFLSTV